jgi:hypothetical protein
MYCRDNTSFQNIASTVASGRENGHYQQWLLQSVTRMQMVKKGFETVFPWREGVFDNKTWNKLSSQLNMTHNSKVKSIGQISRAVDLINSKLLVQHRVVLKTP